MPILILRVPYNSNNIVSFPSRYASARVHSQIFFEEHRDSKKDDSQSRRPQPLSNYETAERVWERLLSAHDFGDCLITVATSEFTCSRQLPTALKVVNGQTDFLHKRTPLRG